MSYLYALHDSDEGLKSKGAFHIKPDQASHWNSLGYGIFISVNDFKTPVRRKTNLKKINAWFVELDGGNKDQQVKRLLRGLTPSLIVESKNGLHVYWRAKNATEENWNVVMADRLVPFYGADPNAKDITRILRKPGYNHLKNPSEPFLVKKIFDRPVSYTEFAMLRWYPSKKAIELTRHENKKKHFGEKPATVGDTVWEKIFNMDCEEALSRISGLACVGSETFSFKENTNGTKQIQVNGKSTSCWIDHDGKIGSHAGGGPSVYQWLKYYNHSAEQILQILHEGGLIERT